MTNRSCKSHHLDDSSDENTLLQVAYILSYRDPHYIRSLSLLHALNACPGIKVVVASNTSKGLWRYVQTWRALRRIRAKEAPDVYLMGFRGHEIFWAVHFMIRGTPLAFDALMSPHAALHEEGKGGSIGKWLAPLIRRLEGRILQRADLVLTDTQLHAGYYVRTFGLPEVKVCALPVGAIETELDTSKSAILNTEPFNVLFYGSFLRLHGIEVIVAAAAKLVDLPIRFDFIGGNAGQGKHLHKQCAQSNVTCYTYRRWIPFTQLLEVEIPRASICLGGPFGGTPQARRVVTGKTSQCLALGKATIIGRIKEDYGFVDRLNCLLIEQADADALAGAIRWAYENRSKLTHIGACGHALYCERLSVRVIAERLLPALWKISTAPTAGKQP